ncbi:MAG TPA: tripartite tricarboxylate transporter substrate binding protein, partial [Burkholderiaceae bacterium]
MSTIHRVLAGCLSGCALAASAQPAAYPDQPITLVIPFSAGGDADGAARALAMVAQKALPQPL